MKCIVIDDEPLARDGMRMNIDEVPSLEMVASFSSAIMANDYLLNNQVDLIFLDIEMPGLNGLDFIRGLNHKPIIILTTAYPQFALEAFELEVLDYLVKPIRMDRFLKAINKARELHDLKKQSPSEITLDSEDKFVFIKSERKIVKLVLDDVKYIKGMKDYVIIYTKDGRYITAMNVKTMLSKLPAENFARVSKSYIININKISSLDIDSIDLQGEEIPLGNSYKKDFISKYVSNKIIDRNS